MASSPIVAVQPFSSFQTVSPETTALPSAVISAGNSGGSLAPEAFCQVPNCTSEQQEGDAKYYKVIA
jgi:hypothetical protein